MTRATMRAAMRATRLEAGLAAVAQLVPAFAAAQVGNALPRSTAMGGSYTALARGFSAVLWNPAGLGLPGNPRLSFSLLPVSASAGLGPVTLGDLARYDGALIPHETRVRWLDAIRAEDGEAGVAGTDVTYLIFNIGQVAVSAYSAANGPRRPRGRPGTGRNRAMPRRWRPRHRRGRGRFRSGRARGRRRRSAGSRY